MVVVSADSSEEVALSWKSSGKPLKHSALMASKWSQMKERCRQPGSPGTQAQASERCAEAVLACPLCPPGL